MGSFLEEDYYIIYTWLNKVNGQGVKRLVP